MRALQQQREEEHEASELVASRSAWDDQQQANEAWPPAAAPVPPPKATGENDLAALEAVFVAQLQVRATSFGKLVMHAGRVRDRDLCFVSECGPPAKHAHMSSSTPIGHSQSISTLLSEPCLIELCRCFAGE
jgi:hypothetical protein